MLVVLTGAEQIDNERVLDLLEDLLLRLHVLHLRQQQQGCGCERRGHPSEAAEAVVCACTELEPPGAFVSCELGIGDG